MMKSNVLNIKVQFRYNFQHLVHTNLFEMLKIAAFHVYFQK